MKEYDCVFVVEGRHDAIRLKNLVKAEVFVTDGLNVPEDLLATLKELSKSKEIVVFTDPDSPGNRIRQKIAQEIPGVRHAFVSKEDALGKHKVGVEHATDETILEALEHITPSKMKEDTLTYGEYLRLGLTGDRGSRERRLKLSKVLHIGYADAKVFFRYLNLIGVSAEDLERMLKDEE